MSRTVLQALRLYLVYHDVIQVFLGLLGLVVDVCSRVFVHLQLQDVEHESSDYAEYRYQHDNAHRNSGPVCKIEGEHVQAQDLHDDDEEQVGRYSAVLLHEVVESDYLELVQC